MRRRGQHHSRVGGLRPRRTAFDLSYEKKFDCSFGQLIPVMHDEVVPGDHFTISAEQVVRMHPMVAPLLHEMWVYTHYFFVPYRLLWNQWENFISGGPDGKFNEPLPRWTPPTGPVLTYMLWDYMGFPVHYGRNPIGQFSPVCFPKRAYNFVWNEFFRDENFQAKVGLSDPADYTLYDPDLLDSNEIILSRNWTKDYFTSALPWQQRGDPVAFPIQGLLPVNFSVGPGTSTGGPLGGVYSSTDASGFKLRVANDVQSGVFYPSFQSGTPVGPSGFPNPGDYFRVGPAYANLGNAATFDVADLRLAVQLQKWMERNARGGVRYTELLRTHFGVAPSDSRLQRPEYIGGTKQPVVVSEVLQTSQTNGSQVSGIGNTPQGTMVGHGMMAAGNFVGKYFVREYGIIIGLLSVMVPPSYENGIDRQWLRYTNTDFYWPEFVNLSEQGIFNAELYADGVADPTGDESLTTDAQVWGYQPVYDEMRIKRNMVCGGMRVRTAGLPSLSYWHMGRSFYSLPNLNSDFITVNKDENQFKRGFAVQSVPPLLVSHANRIRAVRPIPYIGEPGLVDHH